MPRACEPGGKFPIVLDSDRAKEEPPKFFARHLNAREWRKLAQVQDKLDDHKSADQQIESVLTALAEVLVGWEGMTDRASGQPLPFSIGDLDLVVDHLEAVELLLAVMRGNRVEPEDKKKSESPA